MGTIVNTFAWRAALFVARALDRNERDAVCGDLIESRTSGARALLSIAGLVARRESTAWLDWHPWLALITIAIPAGVLLSHVSRLWADTHAIYASLYVQRWSDVYLETAGSRREMLMLASIFVMQAVTLAVWSWTTGRALGALSRRTMWLTGIVFCLLVFAATVGSSNVPRGNNHIVFGQHFYAIVFPRLIRLTCVIAPALWGLYGQRRPISIRSAVVAGAALAVLMLAGRGSLAQSFVPLAILWPACCLIVTSISAHRAMKHVAAIGLVVLAIPALTFAQNQQDDTQGRGEQRDDSASASTAAHMATDAHTALGATAS